MAAGVTEMLPVGFDGEIVSIQMQLSAMRAKKVSNIPLQKAADIVIDRSLASDQCAAASD
jgi:hypothetical protein